MSSAAQRSELQSQIWKIANEVRGSVDGWDFKQYVLGTLFYRFISENFSNYIEGGDESVNYAELDDKIITKEIIDDAIKTKGYFIYPSQLFSNIAKNANTNENKKIKEWGNNWRIYYKVNFTLRGRRAYYIWENKWKQKKKYIFP